jgi:hypothetical protein
MRAKRVGLARDLTREGAIGHVGPRHPVEAEHDGPTGLGRRPGARDGQRAAGHGNLEVRLEGLAPTESPW